MIGNIVTVTVDRPLGSENGDGNYFKTGQNDGG